MSARILFAMLVASGASYSQPSITNFKVATQGDLDGPTPGSAAPGRWIVSLRFSEAFLESDDSIVRNPSHYRIEFLSKDFGDLARRNEPIRVTRVTPIRYRDIGGGVRATEQLELEVGPRRAVIPGDEFRVVVSGLPFRNAMPPPVSQVPAADLTATYAVPKPAAEGGTLEGDFPFALQASKTREKSDVYLKVDGTRSSGTDTFVSVDAKLAIPYLFMRGTRLHKVSPLFDLKASTLPDADPDSLKAGLDWWSGLSSRAIWQNGAFIEASRDFSASNFIASSRLVFTPPRLARLFILDPFLGIEAGKNIDSPVWETKGKAIFRPLLGSTLSVPLEFKQPLFESIELTGSYIRRWPLVEELTFEDDSETKGAFTTVTIGKSPRDYVEAGLDLGVNDFLSFQISYTYGAIPPLFKLVDHRAQIGFVFKGGIKR